MGGFLLAAVGALIGTTALIVVKVGSSAHQNPLLGGGFFEASAIAHVEGSRQFLFVDDDRPRDVLVLELSRTGVQEGVVLSVPLGVHVTDMEGITSDGEHFYVVGSQSKATGFEGDGLVRFTYDPASRRIGSVESIRGLKAWLAEHVPELRGVDHQRGDHALNVEGLAWDPAGQRLLLGLRAPVVDDHALVVPVQLGPGAPFSRENLRIAGATIRLALNGAGIRSIEFDENSRSFVLITGAALNEETREFQVMEWNGDPTSAPREIAAYHRALKPEGMTRAVLEGRSVRVLVFDTSRFAVIE
jgi:hypothetical protein